MKKFFAGVGLIILLGVLAVLPLDGHWTHLLIPATNFPIAFVAGIIWSRNNKVQCILSISYGILSLIVLLVASAIALADGGSANGVLGILWILTATLPFIGNGFRSEPE